MSLPGLDSGAVRVDHAWEAAAPWQVSCEEGERVYRVGRVARRAEAGAVDLDVVVAAAAAAATTAAAAARRGDAPRQRGACAAWLPPQQAPQ